MIKLLLIILFVVVAFTAIGLSIAKSFRVKNQIISYIEEYEGCAISEGTGSDISGNCEGRVGELISNYLNKFNYNSGYNVSMEPSTNGNGYYYAVIVYIDWNIPFINSSNDSILTSDGRKGTGGRIAISGKTDLIKRVIS